MNLSIERKNKISEENILADNSSKLRTLLSSIFDDNPILPRRFLGAFK